MTFAVVLFTILVQAVSISGLLSWLGLTQSSQQPGEYHRIKGKLLAIRSASRYLDRLHLEDSLLPTTYATVKGELSAREDQVSGQMEDLLAQHPEYHEQIISIARVEALRAERSALEELSRNGLLNEETMIELQVELDEAIESVEDTLVA